MITPAEYNLEAVIGRTFDVTLVIFAEEPPIRWREPVLWAPTKYKVFDAVIGSDGNAYKCQIENHAINPVGDSTGTWALISPENITGWSALAHVNAVSLTSPSSGVTLGGVAGTVRVEMTPTQSNAFVPGEHPWDLSLTTATGQEYEYTKGVVKWKAVGE
jgi:hypothetical protein